MKKSIIISIFLLPVWFSTANAQPTERKITYPEYIEAYRDIAIRKMSEFGIPASITLAQGLLESGFGNSDLARNANNHFGIKCHKEWTGMTYIQDDDEKDECFRKYASAEESFSDHSYFLTSRPRYAELFSLDIKDYKGWAYGLKKAGYATNPRYAEMLIKIIEENELYLYDSNPTGPFAKKIKPVEPKVRVNREKSVQKIQLNPSNVEFIQVGDGNRPIYINNGVRLTFARKGDNIAVIAKDFGVHDFQLFKYNEMGRNEILNEGQVVYVLPKKGKSKTRNHTVVSGETMRDISQFYGVRLKSLYKLNKMQSGHEPEEGDRVKLRK